MNRSRSMKDRFVSTPKVDTQNDRTKMLEKIAKDKRSAKRDLIRFSTVQGQYTTPMVLVNSNPHGQIKVKAVTRENSSILELVRREKFPDMSITEINVATPTVVNILDDTTVYELHQMIKQKIHDITNT